MDNFIVYQQIELFNLQDLLNNPPNGYILDFYKIKPDNNFIIIYKLKELKNE